MTQQVVDGIWWIPGQDLFLPDSHVYVIGQPGGGDFSIVECGLMDMGSYKIDELDKIGVSPNQVKRIIMTHTHLDHIGCLPELRKDLPDAELWIHEDEAGPIESGDTRIVFGNRMFESMVKSQWRIDDGAFETPVHRKLKDGDLLELGGIPFKVIHLPGHSIGCIGLFNEEKRILISGDTIYADGAIGRFDLFSADAGQLKRSLEIVGELGVDILLPSHNRIVEGGADPMVRQTIAQWAPYLTQ